MNEEDGAEPTEPAPYDVPQTFRLMPDPGVPTYTYLEIGPDGVRDPMAGWGETIRRVGAGLQGLFHPEAKP